MPSIRRDCLLAQRRAINGNVSVHLGPAGIVACRSDEPRGNRTYSLTAEKEPIPNCYSSFRERTENVFFSFVCFINYVRRLTAYISDKANPKCYVNIRSIYEYQRVNTRKISYMKYHSDDNYYICIILQICDNDVK